MPYFAKVEKGLVRRSIFVDPKHCETEEDGKAYIIGIGLTGEWFQMKGKRIPPGDAFEMPKSDESTEES